MKLKIDFKIKPVLNYVLVILATSLGITAGLIALPLTERISERTTFNLLTKDDFYSSAEYYVSLDTIDNKEVEQTRNIFFKRLDRFGVEKISIQKTDQDSATTTLRIVVNTTRDLGFVRELILNKYDVTILEKKDDVDFFENEDPYAYLNPENYNATEWTKSDFRNIHITELRTTDKSYSNFAIFKPWTNKQGAFNDFLADNKGDYIGVSTDGSVMPYLVPLEENNIFAVPLPVEDETQVEAISILYNSGNIPVNYSIVEENRLDPQVIEIDHIKISIGLFVSLILVYLYILLTQKATIETLAVPFLATLLTLSIYLSVLKFFNIPVDTFLLPIIGIIVASLIKIVSANDDSIFYIEGGFLVTLSVILLFGYGYTEILANHLFPLVVLSKISLIASGWYINKLRRI
ncbi:MAG: transmembrane(s)protein [candidate division WS6 bacterium 36_33]|uniref:Transmembrane(S)protein n=1 Tax=candidate division WS6 bacterium 36_33 TaxID=1641388 RepID=A0A101GZH8_9BACT|nr:MAG: transmembrane(s)protein [candidate division WS6 bacterium 36_33]